MRHWLCVALALAGCGAEVVEDDGLCVVPDGAVVDCAWDCLSAEGEAVPCDSEQAARACWSGGEPVSCERGR